MDHFAQIEWPWGGLDLAQQAEILSEGFCRNFSASVLRLKPVNFETVLDAIQFQ